MRVAGVLAVLDLATLPTNFLHSLESRLRQRSVLWFRPPERPSKLAYKALPHLNGRENGSRTPRAGSALSPNISESFAFKTLGFERRIFTFPNVGESRDRRRT